MNLHPNGAAKRLTFSLLFAATLSGCAVYSPYPADYAYYPGYYSGYYPYGYSSSLYSGVPYYVGPPVTLDLWFGYGNYGRYGYAGYHGYGGYRGYGGYHGYRGYYGGHRGGYYGGGHGGWGGGHR